MKSRCGARCKCRFKGKSESRSDGVDVARNEVEFSGLLVLNLSYPYNQP